MRCKALGSHRIGPHAALRNLVDILDIDQNTRLAWGPTRCERAPLPNPDRLLAMDC